MCNCHLKHISDRAVATCGQYASTYSPMFFTRNYVMRIASFNFYQTWKFNKNLWYRWHQQCGTFCQLWDNTSRVSQRDQNIISARFVKTENSKRRSSKISVTTNLAEINQNTVVEGMTSHKHPYSTTTKISRDDCTLSLIWYCMTTYYGIKRYNNWVKHKWSIIA